MKTCLEKIFQFNEALRFFYEALIMKKTLEIARRNQRNL